MKNNDLILLALAIGVVYVVSKKSKVGRGWIVDSSISRRPGCYYGSVSKTVKFQV